MEMLVWPEGHLFVLCWSGAYVFECLTLLYCRCWVIMEVVVRRKTFSEEIYDNYPGKWHDYKQVSI